MNNELYFCIVLILILFVLMFHVDFGNTRLDKVDFLGILVISLSAGYLYINNMFTNGKILGGGKKINSYTEKKQNKSRQVDKQDRKQNNSRQVDKQDRRQNNSRQVDNNAVEINRYNLTATDGHVIDKNTLKSMDPEVIEILTKRTSPKVCHHEKNCTLNDYPSRILEPDAKTISYERRKLRMKRTLHWGQLKLMLTEVEFLSLALQRYKELNDNRPIHMIYAGAAPGHHIVYLSKLFPMIYFDLYDPNDFAISETDKIKINVQFFTDVDASYWQQQSDKFVIFASDIRTEPATEENVRKNMEMQLDWWKVMNPEVAMFKFRLPWTEGETEYPEGDIYIQPYPGPTSTETRLIVYKNAAMKKYNHTKYEQQMFYHNTIARIKCYKTALGVKLDFMRDGIDNCYDCASFITIIDNYLTAVNWGKDNNSSNSSNNNSSSSSINSSNNSSSNNSKSSNNNSSNESSSNNSSSNNSKSSNSSNNSSNNSSSNIARKHEIRRLINDLQNNITFGKHTIYSQTVKHFNSHLDMMQRAAYVKCNNKSCTTCSMSDDKINKVDILSSAHKFNKKSRATEGALNRAIEQAKIESKKESNNQASNIVDQGLCDDTKLNLIEE